MRTFTAARRSPLITAFAFAASTSLLGYVGYLNIFSHFADYDDEGYFLIVFQQFHQGGRLYNDLHTIYGPVHFEVFDAVFSLFRLPLTHDAGRTVSLVLWVSISLVCGLLLYAVSGSLLLGCGTEVLVFHALLLPMVDEASLHPTVLVCLFLAFLAGTALLLPSHPRVGLALQGALVTALSLIKINVGVLALVALAVFWVLSLPVLRRRRAIVSAVVMLYVVTPAVLMHSQIGDSRAQRVAIVVMSAAAAVVLTLLFENDRGALQTRDFTWLAAAAAATLVLSLLGILLRGTTLMAMVDNVLLMPAKFPVSFYSRINLGPLDRLIAAGCLVLCVAAMIWRRRVHDAGRVVLIGSGVIRLATGLLLLYSVSGIYRRLPLGFLFAPLVWVMCFKPSRTTDSPEVTILRRLLPPLAVLQTLQAYPVSGSKVFSSSFLLIPIGAICLLDGWREIGFGHQQPSMAMRRWSVAAASVLALIVFGGLLLSLRRVHDRYADGVPLPLPGSTRIHLSPAEATTLTRLVGTIERRCDSFIALPSSNSFYIWSRQQPPKGLDITWSNLLFSAEQTRVVDALRSIDRLCVVWRPDVWRRRDGPVMDYIGREFKRSETHGRYVFMVRTGTE